jgi:hypothetical protein
MNLQKPISFRHTEREGNMLNPLKDSRGIGKTSVIILILIVAAVIYLGKKLGVHYYAYYDLQRDMQYWTEMCLTRNAFDRDTLVSNVMDTIQKHKIPLKEGSLKIEYNPEELTARISAEYTIKVKFPRYTHIVRFHPYAEHTTTPP